MKEFHTPQKDHSRSSELANRRSKDSSSLKKSKNISKKSLAAAFTSVSEDVPLDVTKESFYFSSISQISDDNQNCELDDCYLLPLNPAPSTPSETSVLSDLSSSSILTTENEKAGHVSEGHFGFDELNSLNSGTVEADILVKLLRQARSQLFNSAGADIHSKKLLDGLIKIVIEELHSVPKERGRSTELISAKTHVVCLFLLPWILVMFASYFFSIGSQSTFHIPPPT